jgi:hypothetical protein
VSPVKYELGFYIPEDDILHSHRREYLKSYTDETLFDLLNALNNGGKSPISGLNGISDNNSVQNSWLLFSVRPSIREQS